MAGHDQPGFTVQPIGFVRSGVVDRFRAPRQPVEDSEHEACIELLPGRNFEQALEDLAGFERIWIVAWLHGAATWKPKVLPPRGPRAKRGVFATRSPHRPNPIGMSLARLLKIKGLTLRIGEIDLLDGTPVLDLKPYLPYADAFPNARAGWVDELLAEFAASGAAFKVVWGPLALEQTHWLREHFGIVLQDVAERVLCNDPHPHPYRRISETGEDRLQLAIKSWRVLFSLETAGRIEVECVASGYPAEALQAAPSGEPLHDRAAHEAFHARWPEA